MGTETLVKITEDKKIELKPIVRKRPFYSKGHDGEFMFTGCKQGYTLPYMVRSGSFVKIFKDGEQEAFETELNKQPGALSLYNRKSEFWTNFSINIGKEGITLDLNNPIHALQYKIVKANKDYFAPSWAERFHKKSYKYAIIDDDITIEEENKSVIELQKSMELFSEIKNSKQKMSNVLRLLKKKVPATAEKDWLNKELIKIISNDDKVKGIPSRKDFINAAEDKLIDSKVFILDAIDANAIITVEGAFRQADNNSLIGRSLQDAVDHYNNPEYQEDKILIQERIKRANKK